jgi:protocatechuate 3,4-dioxygenase beta subunit
MTRRGFLVLPAAAAVVLAACEDDNGDSADPTATTEAATEPAGRTASPTQSSAVLEPTPSCTDDDDVTIEQTEGPYYTPDTPERTSLREARLSGTNMTLTGFVLSTACQPIAGALLDFWHADDAGEYDNEGNRLRGHQFADDQGGFVLETVVPGLYPDRTRHIHVKVQAPNQPVLTTQLYFPGEPDNAIDAIYADALLMDVADTANGKSATFTFVLNV